MFIPSYVEDSIDYEQGKLHAKQVLILCSSQRCILQGTEGLGFFFFMNYSNKWNPLSSENKTRNIILRIQLEVEDVILTRYGDDRKPSKLRLFDIIVSTAADLS